MECNIQECQLLKLKDDLGLLIVDKDFDIETETLRHLQDRFSGIEPLTLVRDSDDSGLGRLYFRGVYLCDTLENPAFFMPIGTYRLISSYSKKFKKFLPEIIIPGHKGVRIHAANYCTDLEGCVSVGSRNKLHEPILNHSSFTLDRILYTIDLLDIHYFRFS